MCTLIYEENNYTNLEDIPVIKQKKIVKFVNTLIDNVYNYLLQTPDTYLEIAMYFLRKDNILLCSLNNFIIMK